MSTTGIISPSNHLSTQDHQRDIFLDEIYQNLQNIFSTETFTVFEEKCQQVKSQLDDSIYFPIKFDSTKHKKDSTTAKDYLNLLPDEDPNVDLKSLIPVEILNDGSVLFRSVASLIGLSFDENVRELKLRCVVDAVSNLLNYVKDYKELLGPLLYPDEIRIKHWSHFVQEKDRMDPPNIITVLTLFALAKVINIPIRSVYPSPSKQVLNKTPNHIYRLINRVFYPSYNQHHHTGNIPKPIIILWWYTNPNGAMYPDHVVPLFPDDKHNVKYSTDFIESKKPDIVRPININYSPPVVQRRGTYILIFTAVTGNKVYPTQKRINDMKIAIIELIKTVSSSANPGDIIQVNTCDDELIQPPLIPFCEAIKINTKNNFDLINNIKFHEGIHSNMFSCISAALDKLARQSVYYTNLFWIIDNLINCTPTTAIEKSVLRILRESPSIESQMIVTSQELNDQKEYFESSQILRVDYLHNNNDIPNQIIALYNRNRSSQEVKKPQALIVSTSKNESCPILPVHTTLHFVQTEHSASIMPSQHQNNYVQSFTSVLAHPNTWRYP